MKINNHRLAMNLILADLTTFPTNIFFDDFYAHLKFGLSKD